MIDYRDQSIRFEAYKSLATRGSEFIDLLESGEAFEEDTLQLRSDLHKTVKILKALEFGDRLETNEYNRLLYCLIDISKINEFPTAPILRNNKKPNIAIETIVGQTGGVGQKGDKGDGFFHVQDDITLTAALIATVEGDINYTSIAPYTASVLTDARSPAEQSDTPGIVGDMTRHSIHWNGVAWSDNGIWAGEDGDNIELRVDSGFIQWKLTQASTWINLVALSAITGPTGATGATGGTGATGATGARGFRGWSGQLVAQTRPGDGALVLQLQWIGGESTIPPGNNNYLTSSGTLTTNINSAARINGVDAPARIFINGGVQDSKTNISFNFGTSEILLRTRNITNNSGFTRFIKIVAWVGISEDDNTEGFIMRIRRDGISGTELMSSFDRVDNGGVPNWQRFRVEYTDSIGNGSTRNYAFTLQQIFGDAMRRTDSYMEIYTLD